MPIAYEVLRRLQEEPDWSSSLVVSYGAETTIDLECDFTLDDLIAMADEYYENTNIGASIASGTFPTEGMIVVPCSMKTLAGIAAGYSDTLLLRAADVTIKERRKLTLVARETPLNSIHLRNMLELSRMGVIIMPPMQTYYNRPKTARDMADHMAGKILDVYGISYDRFRRWDPGQAD